LKSRPQLTRRAFLTSSPLALAGLALNPDIHAQPKSPILDASTLAPFVDPLPIPAIAQPAGTRPDPDNPKQRIPFYRLPIAETPIKLHRDLPPTRMWTIGGSFPGLTLESPIAQGMIVEWQNRLPSRHLFTIDHTLHGAEKTSPDVRAVIHLHGGRTPAASDGYPEEWTLPGRSQTCHYPSLQHAATLFYHDHTMGINRLNTYAGMLGFCILRDSREDPLRLPTGPHDIPLLICDRILRADGQLDYPVSEKPGEVWVSEVFGDAILVNGKLLPHLDVEPTLYRFRLMNASNGRFFRFSLRTQAPFHAITSDQGLLAAPVPLRRITLAPAERADILIDFSSLPGERTELISDSFSILQFRVAPTNNKAVILSDPERSEGESKDLLSNKVVIPSGASAKSRDLLLSAPRSRSNSVLPTALHPIERIPESAAVRTRQLTLDERMDMIQHSMGMLLNNTPWHARITEKPVLHTTEIWELVNLTDDSHPIHLHLVRFQILDRRPFDTFEYQSKGTLHFFGSARPPAPEEMGWKDTVRADPAMVTRIIIPFDGYHGRYVWHCHILEHEDNEMMRPFEVLPVSS
jgi:spore coat protein A